MGVIARQSFKKTIAMVAGALVGTISTLFIYPMDLEFIGELRFILAVAMFLIPFGSLGVYITTIKFYPHFKNKENRDNGYLGMLLMGSLLAYILMCLIWQVGDSYMLKALTRIDFEPERIRSNIWPIGVLGLFVIWRRIIVDFVSLKRRVAVTEIISEFSIKLLMPTLVLISVYGTLDTQRIEWLFVAGFGLIVIMLLVYLSRLGSLNLRPTWSSLNKSVAKEFSTYALYGIVGGMGSMVAFRIDAIMVSGLIDFKSNGIYGIAMFIANIVYMPYRSIVSMSNGFLTDFIAKDNWKEVKNLYQKSSSVLMVVGLFLFLGVWFNLEPIFYLTNNEELLEGGKQVVLFIGLAKIIDMSASLNSTILGLSDKYRWNLLMLLLLAVLTITSNLYFIPRMGIAGAALATLISLSVFNLVKFGFIWAVFKMQPFTKVTLYLVLISGVAWLILSFVPETGSYFVDMLIRSLLVVLLFGLPVYWLKLVPDINTAIDKYAGMAMSYIRRS